MKVNAYSVYDVKTNVYFPPTFSTNDAAACRGLTLAVMETRSPIRVYPDDFNLVHVGEFDDVSGAMTAIEPRFIASVRDLLAQIKEKE